METDSAFDLPQVNFVHYTEALS